MKKVQVIATYEISVPEFMSAERVSVEAEIVLRENRSCLDLLDLGFHTGGMDYKDKYPRLELVDSKLVEQ